MRTHCSTFLRPVLALTILLGLAATRSAASPMFSIIDLGATDTRPSVPESLVAPRVSNSFGESITSTVPVGGPNPLIERAWLNDGEGHSVQVGVIGDDAGSRYALAINDAGQVVGRAMDSKGIGHGFIYTDGKSFDLNTLILASSLPWPDPRWVVTNATNINNSGTILGIASVDGVDHTVLLTPTSVPEPTTLALFGVVIAAAAFRADAGRRRSR